MRVVRRETCLKLRIIISFEQVEINMPCLLPLAKVGCAAAIPGIVRVASILKSALQGQRADYLLRNSRTRGDPVVILIQGRELRRAGPSELL